MLRIEITQDKVLEQNERIRPLEMVSDCSVILPKIYYCYNDASIDCCQVRITS